MSTRKSAHRRPANSNVRPRPALQPDWPMVLLALIGLVITGYLSFGSLFGTAPLFCGPDSGCDLVQNSRFSSVLGLPISLWGFGLYALIALSAYSLPAKQRRWLRLTWMSALGLAISGYLTVVGLVLLDAWCGWCLASQLVILAMFLFMALRRPEAAPDAGWWVWSRNLAVVLVFVTGSLYAWQDGWLQPPENPELKALAEHLESSGAQYFGAFWCPNCQQQKRVFGRSADRLPYVECSPQGRGGIVAMDCVSNGITAYPTWIIDGARYQRVLDVEELKRLSEFEASDTP
ncbi:MAG: vitamin K epoxide reductase family protein [Pseudomonadota bacterium]